MSELEAIGGEIEDAIERVRVPGYVIDRRGIIRYLNPAAQKIVGDVRGRQFTSVVAPEETRRAREIFTRNLRGRGPARTTRSWSSTRKANGCQSRSARFRSRAATG